MTPLSQVLSGYSKALYSSWLYYKPDRILVDCGEGAASTLGNNCFAIESILLTHGHIDHVSGLPGFLWARTSAMGANEKPLRIYFPRGDIFFADMRAYIDAVNSKFTFPLEWIPLEAGESFELQRGRSVECFATQHSQGSASLGYKIIETRKRLRPEWANLGQAEIRQRIQSGETTEAMMEEYAGIKLAHGGDGLPLDPNLIAGSEILVHEATILDAANRKGQSHSTLGEALEVANAAQPGTLLLNHISGRYKRSEIETAIREGATQREIGFPIWCLRQDNLWPVWNPDSSANLNSPAAEPS
ncbi:MBL fold metallo-hydrolase [bacterium]|nr:MAG: MBL fold metallo-hydrolase [bacterium]